MANLTRGYERRGNGTGWTDAEDAQLRELWASKLSCGKIGRAIGRGKNSIVSRAHRLNLPKRPSPIRAKKAKRPPVAWGVHIAAVRAAGDQARRLTPLGPPPKHCQWIEGEPTANDSCKCGAPVLPEFSYCAEHVYRAYLKPAERKVAA